MVTGTDINNASIDLKNAEIALLTAQATYQQKQSALNILLAQQNVDTLTTANATIAAAQTATLNQASPSVG